MNKHIWMRPVAFILILLLSGCSLTGFEAESEPREVLDISKWPTPVVTTPTPQPTPFPKTTVVLSQAAPSPTPEPTSSPTIPAVVNRVPAGTTTQLIEQVVNITGGLAPVAVLKTSAAETTIRQGPSDSYGAAGVVEKGELAGVLGIDPSGEWVYVLTIRKLRGWHRISDARIVGSLDGAPVLPPDPVAAILSSAAAAGSSAATTTGAVSNDVLNVATLDPVATARVSSALLNLRQRPGPNYAEMDMLPADAELAILGVNRDGRWALVSTADGKSGWVSVDFLTVTGSLANAPQYRTLEPGSNAAPNQTAPVVPLSSTATSAAAASAPQPAAASPSNSPAGTIPAAAVVSNPSLPSNTLAPKGEAQVIRKEDMRKGPDRSFGALHTARVDEIMTVHAVNEDKSWLLVSGTNYRIGWLPADGLTVNQSLENVQPVLTGLVTSNELKIYSGPGIFHDSPAVMALNQMVSILALNEGRNWALVEAVSGVQGWIQLRLLEVNGPLSGLPEMSAPLPAQQAAAAMPSLPAPPSGPPSGTIVFQTASGGDIMVINADGSGLRRLTNGIDPVLSPDGQQVAFTRWQGDTGTLWVTNVDGSGERAVLGEMNKAKGPAWSPDGSQIVLNFQQGGRLSEERGCHDPGRRPPLGAYDISVTINDEGEAELCWTVAPNPNWTLRVVDVADSSFENLYGGLYAFRPAWDPSQPWRVISVAGDGLLAVDVNRDDYRNYLSKEISDSAPVFSPDGRFLAVATKKQGGNDIYRMNRDGSGRVQLTETPLWVPLEPGNRNKVWNNVAPTWSPDGSQIAFLTDRAGPWQIWVMNADGSNPQPLFSDEINSQLEIRYDFVDERVLSWR